MISHAGGWGGIYTTGYMTSLIIAAVLSAVAAISIAVTLPTCHGCRKPDPQSGGT
jgi:hypothetical protein